jgi:hypothetical protein
MKSAAISLLVLIGLITSALVNAAVEEFLPNDTVYRLSQNQSVAQCVNSELETLTDKKAILIIESLAGHDSQQAESMNSGLIQALISLTKNTSVGLFNRSSVFEGFDFKKFKSQHFVSATFAGFESGGASKGKGFGLSTKHVGFGSGQTQGKSLLQMDFHITKPNGEIVDGFSLANIVNHIDDAGDGELGGKSFSFYLDFSTYREESKALARRVILNHAAVMIVESIIGKKLNCHYKGRRIAIHDVSGGSNIEVITIMSSHIPIKSKRFYFKSSDARSLRCKKHKCKVAFRGKANQDVAVYMEDALLNAFPEDNDIDVSCYPKKGQIACKAIGNVKGFSKRKFKRNLYGS